MRNAKLLVIIYCFWLCGCSTLEYFEHEEHPYDQELSNCYDQTKLKTSSAADVLAVIRKAEADFEMETKREKVRLGKFPFYKKQQNGAQTQLLSQSKSVIAWSGQKKKGYKRWFNMVAFDEGTSSGDKERLESPGYGLTAKRKYLFIVDDKPNILEEPRKSLSFDCKMILATQILDEPYSNENAMRIAILKEVQVNFRKDIDEVGQDNKELAVSGMMVNQVLETILVKLDERPVLASNLSGRNGVEFEHISLGKGKIGMLIESDIVTVKIRLGTLVREFEELGKIK